MAKRAEYPEGSWDDRLSAFGGHPLRVHVSSIRESALESGETSPGSQLWTLGVTDAEQLVALANVDDGRDKLASTLNINKTDLDALVKEAKKSLPPSLAAEMEHPLPPMYPLGALEPTPEMRSTELPPAVGFVPQALTLAESVNLISNMSPIRQQGARGTCVSFALTAIHEYARRVQGSPRDLSEQYLYDQMKILDQSPACGTWQHVGAKVLPSQGQCVAMTWPYNPNLPCNKNGVKPANADADAANYKVNLVALSPTDVTAIKSALAAQRPVGISIPVYNSWYLNPETKRSGRITLPLTNDTRAGGHAVCLVGYQDDSAHPGGGYFILRNSWGTTWGYQNPYAPGYGVIPYQYLTAYNWEAYTLANTAGSPPAPVPTSSVSGTRTITITVRGNVHFIIE